MVAKRRRLDKLPQASIPSSLQVRVVERSHVNNDPKVNRPVSAIEPTEDDPDPKFLPKTKKKWSLIAYGALCKSKVVVGRPKKTAFENGSLLFQKYDNSLVQGYVRSRDYVVYPKRFRSDFASESAFDAWLDVDETDGSPIRAVQALQVGAKKSYRWQPFEIEVVLQKYFQLSQNKHATVRWFQNKLPGSVIALRLQPSNLQCCVFITVITVQCISIIV
ncbi:hypothetical protein CYMTET_48130 [Cymbomonas tetramitiformis]|uniref:Uncharacterized protein n=1 Tax=Cymbomonas tetramitiformis TaxID=36881 RepID=A0AAE0BSV3_9CHLO|nr:hypothetical protein CYMTET_48130 [Cymbomonas tetramitiformis]